MNSSTSQPSPNDNRNEEATIDSPSSSSKKAHLKTAWLEIEQDKRDMGIWAEAFAICKGDESKTIAKYIEFRVANLLEIKNGLNEETHKLKRKTDEAQFYKLQVKLKRYSYKLLKEGDGFIVKRGIIFVEKKSFDSLDDVKKFRKKLMNQQAGYVLFFLLLLFIIYAASVAD